MAQPTKQRGVKAAFANLPDDYRNAVGSLSVTEKVNEISANHGLTDQQSIDLDHEVTYLLLLIQSTEQFMKDIEQKLEISEQKVAALTDSVTEKILQPIQNKVSDNNKTVPAPPPPPEPQNKETTTSGYAGNTDPYREPVDE